VRPKAFLPLFATAVGLVACGDSQPPDRAASEAQIKQTVVAYNALTMAGNGEAACKLKDDQSLPGGMAKITPGIHDCASLWTRIGPTFSPPARERALKDRPASISVSGEQAVAAMTTGADLDLIWTDGRWKLR
jgi:hypothetical protein